MSHRSLLAGVGSLALCFVLAAQESEEKPQATGRFETQKVDFEVAGAYALEGMVGLGEEAGIKVAISNVPFGSEFIDRYWDREHLIDSEFANEETAVVWFGFSPRGDYRGLSYYLGPGDGCGHCFDSEVRSDVKVRNGRIAGTLKYRDPEGVAFDLSFDVPLAPTGHGEPLPADGGEPGKAYLAYHQALAAGDPAALRPVLSSNRLDFLAESAEEFMAYLRESHPESYRLAGGFVDGEHALLLTRGERALLGKVHTEVHLFREEEQWVVRHEVLQMGEE